MCSCSIVHKNYTNKSMGVTGTSNRSFWFGFTGYFFFFLLIPGTHTGTAFITTTAILSDSFLFFGTNPYCHRLYGKKKLSVSQLCLRSHYISSRRYLYSAYKIYFTLYKKPRTYAKKVCLDRFTLLLYYIEYLLIHIY